MKTETEFQAAVVAFGQRIADELPRELEPRGSAAVGCVIEILIDCRNAETTLRKASRMKDVRPSYLAHLRSVLRWNTDNLQEALEAWGGIFDGVDPARLLKISHGVLKQTRRFVAETFPSLATDADVAFVKGCSGLAADPFIAAVCDFICYDRSVPKAIQVKIWGRHVPVRVVPNTSTARYRPRRKEVVDVV